MSRPRPTSPGKLRTREHVLADLSINHVERHALLSGYSVDRTQHDYGYDLTMATYNERGEIEPGAVYIQVKATDQLDWLAGGETTSWPVSRRDLKLWLEEVYPVILVVYDGKRDKGYWLDIQEYFLGGQASKLFSAGQTIRVHVPARNRMNHAAIRQIARHKNSIHRQLLQKGS